MENFIEKLKGVDKKVWIGVGIGAAVVILLIVALIIGLGNKPTGGNQGGSQNGTQHGTETEGGVTEEFGTELLGTEMTTETEMGTETEMTESESESQTQGIGGTTVTKPDDVNGVEQQPVTVTPDGEEMLGDGTAKNPYTPLPNSSMSYKTITIPAGKSVYYSLKGAGNMWLTIEDANAFVIESNGTRHNAKNGKVGFTVEDALASDYVTFQIGNSGSTAKSFTIKLANLKGSWNNPAKITTAGQYSIHLSAGEEVGYHYKYIAEKKGTIRFYIVSESTKCELTVTNNRNMAQRTFQAEVQEDAKGRYVELSADLVEAGDEFIIIVCAQKYRGEIPAADVKWEIVYVE